MAKKPTQKPTKPSKSNPSKSKPAPHGITEPLIHLDRWIRANKKNLTPPVSNKQLFATSKDMVLFVSGGPNTRNDYHVNPTEELFYQVKGNIAVRIRPLDGSKPHDVVVKEGELFLLDRWVPHRPQRPSQKWWSRWSEHPECASLARLPLPNRSCRSRPVLRPKRTDGGLMLD